MKVEVYSNHLDVLNNIVDRVLESEFSLDVNNDLENQILQKLKEDGLLGPNDSIGFDGNELDGWHILDSEDTLLFEIVVPD